MKLVFVASLLLTLGLACAPESRPGGSTPVGGAVGGGGRGGSTGAGGTVGMTTGGMGASPIVGGAAGMPPVGGMGGMVEVIPPGPVEKPDAPALFPGTAATTSKMVSRDASPGYFYASFPLEAQMALPLAAGALAQPELAGLPAGITFAQRAGPITSPANGGKLVILGFNFRQNFPEETKMFRWINATDFAGFSFWAKVTVGTQEASVTLVDSSNLSLFSEYVGTCQEVTVDKCVAMHQKRVTFTTTWTQFKFKWADLLQDPEVPAMNKGEIKLDQLGRVDVLMVTTPGTTMDVLMTDVKLGTAAELN